MADGNDLRSHFESALTELSATPIRSADEGIITTWPIAVDAGSDGSVVIHTAGGGKRCSELLILDIAGAAVTDNNGIAQISLRHFHCRYLIPPGISDTFITYQYPVNVIATPRGNQPAYLTVDSTIGLDPNDNAFRDVLITVCSWRPNGRSLADTRFNWRCTVPCLQSSGSE
jgi:hypothetical protein